MAYIGSTPTSQNFISGTDYFSGTGSQTAFTLTRTVNSVNDIEVVINNVVQQPSTSYTLSGTTITFTSAPSSGTNNIYVRYLATTMQSITVPANSITRTQLDSNLQAGFQGRNRIINGAMLVDQRNAGASGTASSGYPVDRWQYQASQASKVTWQQNAGSVTPPAGFKNYLGITSSSAYSVGSSDYFFLSQTIEGYNIADLGWGSSGASTVTLSFWVRSSLTGTFGGAIRAGGFDVSYPFTYTISSANTWEQKSITITGPTSGTFGSTNGNGLQLDIGLGAGSTYSGTAGAWTSSNLVSATGATSVVGTSGATFYITGVQLEEGTQATSFERESYSVTLQKCQRYYAKMSGGGFSNYCAFAMGFVVSSISIEAVVKYPVTMRASATLNYSNVRTNTASGTNSAVTSFGTNYAGTDSMNATFTSSGSSMTLGQGGSIIGNNNSSAYLELSAEL